MKLTKYGWLVLPLLCMTACGLFGSPTTTVQKYIAATEKGDVEGMTQLFSAAAVQKRGRDKIKEDNQTFSALARKTIARGEHLAMQSIKETITGDKARVSFFYRDDKGVNSLKLVFDLVKEKGSWKIDDIGGAEKEEKATKASPSSAVPL